MGKFHGEGGTASVPIRKCAAFLGSYRQRPSLAAQGRAKTFF
jgi:hypothetical protein